MFQGSNFRLSDPSLAAVWPLVEGDIRRLQPRPPLGQLRPRYRDPRETFADAAEVAALALGGATVVQAAQALRTINKAAKISPGARFTIHPKGRRPAVVERG